MYNFWVQNWLLYKGLYDYNHLRGYVANVVAQPALMVMMYALMGRYAMDAKTSIFIAVGINVSSISYNVISGITRGYANDRWYSMFSILYITKVNRFWNYTARSILYYPTGLLSGIVGLVMIRLLTPLDFGAINWTGLVVAMLVINAAVCAWAEFLGIFAIVFSEWLTILAVALSVTLILSGMIIPLEVFPTALQEIGKLLPMTNGLIAIRAVFNGAPFSAFSFDILREALTGIAYFVIGYFGFVIFERVVKRTGKLEMEQYG